MLVAAVARAPKAATNPKTGQLYTAPTVSKVFKEHCYSVCVHVYVCMCMCVHAHVCFIYTYMCVHTNA